MGTPNRSNLNKLNFVLGTAAVAREDITCEEWLDILFQVMQSFKSQLKYLFWKTDLNSFLNSWEGNSFKRTTPSRVMNSTAFPLKIYHGSHCLELWRLDSGVAREKQDPSCRLCLHLMLAQDGTLFLCTRKYHYEQGKEGPSGGGAHLYTIEVTKSLSAVVADLEVLRKLMDGNDGRASEFVFSCVKSLEEALESTIYRREDGLASLREKRDFLRSVTWRSGLRR